MGQWQPPILLLLLAGCAANFEPKPLAESDFLDRLISQSKAGVTVTAGVPSRRETKALFGIDLYGRGIQPIWLEIKNGKTKPVSFLPVGLDPEYFTPIESATASLRHDRQLKSTHALRARHFFDNKMGFFIEPGETRSGFVFSRADEGTKAFNVDIAAPESLDSLVTFTFFVPVPGLKLDHADIDWAARRADPNVREVGQESLIAALEAMPCCASDKRGVGTADPLNLVVIGEPSEVYYAFVGAEWDETETTTAVSAMRTALSFVTGGEYRYSPISSLYVFSRPQDVAFQKARSSIHERNHLRLWMTELRFQNKPVWIGQISRDIGVRLTRKTIVTHKIDPDVDETREYLLEDLAYSQVLSKFGYLDGVGEATILKPRGNLTGDPYFTDGQRLVLWVTDQPTDIDELESLDWRGPKREAKILPDRLSRNR